MSKMGRLKLEFTYTMKMWFSSTSPTSSCSPPSNSSSELHFGIEAYARKKDRDLLFPINRGIIQDYETMTEIWSSMVSKNPLLISDNPLTTKENKCQTAAVLFEKIGVQ